MTAGLWQHVTYFIWICSGCALSWWDEDWSRGPAPEKPVWAVSTGALFQTQCRVSQCSATCRSLSDQILSSTEELSLKTWTERRGGSVMKPECKLHGPWWQKPHLEFPFSLNLVTYTVQQLLNHYLKNFVTANTINIAVKWAKINKNILGIKIC